METEYTLDAGDGSSVRFDGTLLAEVSTHYHGKRRWTEFFLYRTKAGQWVWQTIGQTTYAREEMLNMVSNFDDPRELIRRVAGKREVLSRPAREMLVIAAERDNEIDGALSDYENTIRRIR